MGACGMPHRAQARSYRYRCPANRGHRVKNLRRRYALPPAPYTVNIHEGEKYAPSPHDGMLPWNSCTSFSSSCSRR
jgi:hypothetical protein